MEPHVCRKIDLSRGIFEGGFGYEEMGGTRLIYMDSGKVAKEHARQVTVRRFFQEASSSSSLRRPS